jgi:hypothetical protein
MPLSNKLLDVDLTLECKHCGHLIIKNGGWFSVAHHFKCEGCNRYVRIVYDEKVALFKKHAHLAP